MVAFRDKLFLLVKSWGAHLISILGGVYFSIQLWHHTHFQYSQLDEGLYAYKGYLFATGKYFPYQDYGLWTNHMPLSFLIPGYVQVMFGPGLRTIRYFSVILALLGLLGIWTISKRFGGKWWAAASIWIVALNPSWARFYSQSTSQVIVYFMLTWLLVLGIDKKLPTWRIVTASILATVIFFTRINMAPVLLFFLGYSYWQFGWRKGIYSTLASLLTVMLGIIIFSPKIIEYMITNTPVKDIQPVFIVIISLVIFGGILIWRKKPKFINKQFFRYSIFLGLAVLFVVVVSVNTIIKVDEQTKQIALNASNHLIFILVGLVGYFILKRGGKKLRISRFGDYIQSNKIKVFTLLLSFESFLFIIPSESKNAWLLLYSKPRIGAMFSSLIFFITVLLFTIKYWRDRVFANSFQGKIKNWFKIDLIYYGVFCISIISIVLNLFVLLRGFLGKDMRIQLLLIRLMPFMIFCIVLGVQTLYFLSIGTKNLAHTHRFMFNVFSTFFATVLVFHINKNLFLISQIRRIFTGFRSHFIPILGLLFVLFFWRVRQNWKSEALYKISVLLTSLFVVLILIHMYAAFELGYCLACFQPYLAFFSQLGIYLLIISFDNIHKPISKRLQVVFVFLVLLIFSGVGNIFTTRAGVDFLIWGFLFISALSILKYIFDRKQIFQRYTMSVYLAISGIVFGSLFSGFSVFGSYQDLDCGVDIIQYYEILGTELDITIPEGSKIFWWSGTPVPLLYLPERHIYPAQLNGMKSHYHIGRDTDQLLRDGFWNETIGKQWVYDADFLIIGGAKLDWLQEIIEEDFEVVFGSPDYGICTTRLGRPYKVYQQISVP